MSVIAEIEEKVLGLSDNERAKLADKLIASLPPDFMDEDELEEVVRRDREMDEDPSTVMTHEEFFSSLRDHIK